MPMSFPTITHVKRAAKMHNFREMLPDESEGEYRAAVADHVQAIDSIEGHEIRTGKGWDKWSDVEIRDMLRRNMARRVERTIEESPDPTQGKTPLF